MENDIENMIVPVAINMLSMEPQSTIRATINPQVPDMDVEWTTTGNGFTIDSDGMSCRVTPDTGFQGDRASGTVVCTVSHQQLPALTASASCSVTVLKQPTAIQLSAVGAPGGYMVTVVQSAESYSRLWKLDAGDVYQGDVCDESGGWQPLPADGIIDAQAGVLTVVDVDYSHGARRAGSVMLQPSANLACYGPVSSRTVSSSVTGDGSLLVERSGGVVGSYDVLLFPLDLPEGTYTASIAGESTDGVLAADVRSRDGEKVFTDLYSAANVFTVEAGDVGDVCMMVGFNGSAPAEASMTVRPMIVSGDHATDMPEWAPGIITRDGVSETRPNLWPVMKDPVTLGGVTFTPNGDGSVTVDGESAGTYPSISVSTVLLPGTYLIRATHVTDTYTQAKWLDKMVSTANGRDGRFTLDSECTVTLQVVCSSNKSFDNVTLTPFLYAETAGGGVSDKRPNLLTYAGFHSADADMAVNTDGSFDLTVTDWTQWRNLSFDFPEGLLAAGREYTLSVQEPYETPTVNMHVRTGGNGYGPLKLTYGKSSVTATPDAISITPNLTIINEKPDPTSGSLRNVRLKLEEGGEPTGWVPPVFSGGGIATSSPR